MQRHHLLPRQLLKRPCFSALIDAVGQDRLGYDDFRRNGLLLPATEQAASRAGLPLHRGPLGKGLDFTELDAMAEALWSSSGWASH